MRFSVPDLFEYESTIPQRSRESLIQLAQYDQYGSLESTSAIATEDIVSYIDKANDIQKRKPYSETDIFNDALARLSQAHLEKAQNELVLEQSKLESHYTYKKQEFSSDLSQLDHLFNHTLSLHAKDANRIVKEIEERTRREEQERLRILQEQRRLEEEQRRKREEAERKRREEAERKRIEAENLKKQQEAAKRQLEERKKQEELAAAKAKADKEAKDAKEAAKLKEEEAKRAKGFTSFTSVESEFLKYKQSIVDIKQHVGQLNADPAMKKEFGQIKRKINPKFGQLSSSFDQLNRISHEVIEYINMTKSRGQLMYDCILNFTAKRIVSQAEAEVTVKPDAAVPLARLTERILVSFPEFEYFLSARLVKKCPFIIGYTCAIDSEQGRMRMGWKRNDQKWELEGKYEERVAGICSVWAVLTRLNDHPQQDLYSLQAAWVFVARMLNTDKKLIGNPHFTVAGNWWEASAAFILKAFGKQGFKLCSALVNDWTESVADKELPAAKALNLLGREWSQTGVPKQLKEMEQ